MDETLQQLAQRRQRELGHTGQQRAQLSTREIWLRGGGEDAWSYETVRRIVDRGHHKISERVAEALANALDVPLGQVFKAAGQRPPLARFELPRRADRLTESERKAVLGVIDAILGGRFDAELAAPAETAPDHDSVNGQGAAS